MDVEIHRHTLSGAVAFLLLVGVQVEAGTITCNDQVGALKAMLADHPDKSIREQLKEAERLCGEGRRAAVRVVRELLPMENASTLTGVCDVPMVSAASGALSRCERIPIVLR
jgi:hypothetical protein